MKSMQKLPLAASILVAISLAQPAMAIKPTTTTPIKHLIVVAGENDQVDTHV